MVRVTTTTVDDSGRLFLDGDEGFVQEIVDRGGLFVRNKTRVRWRCAMENCAGRCCLHDWGVFYRLSLEDGIALFMRR